MLFNREPLAFGFSRILFLAVFNDAAGLGIFERTKSRAAFITWVI
jgi:hypothetical protein